MGKNIYTVRSGDGRGSRKEGSSRLSKKFDTQKEAINFFICCFTNQSPIFQ